MLPLTPELSAELRSIAAGSRLRAILMLRTATGCALREAVDALELLVPIGGRPLGPHAELFAFGRFAPAVAEFMDYEARLFADVVPGTPVSVFVAEASGPEQVVRLAEIVGIDPTDMNEWCLRPEAIDARALDEAGLCDAAQVEALRSAGFSFHFVIASA
jgi:hypothetical protein